MALLLPNSIFFHVPKTGGTWVRSVLHEAGMSYSELPCKTCGPVTSSHIKPCCFHVTPYFAALPSDGRKRFRFAFVRHPLSFYQSYWTYKMLTGWKIHEEFDRTFAFEHFHDFVRAILEKSPHWVTNAYEGFIGPEDAPFVDFVGKQETLRADLARALRMSGDVCNTRLLLRWKKINQAGALSEWAEKCQYTLELAEEVRNAEAGAMRRFGYW